MDVDRRDFTRGALFPISENDLYMHAERTREQEGTE